MMLILVLLGMYFDAVVVFVNSQLGTIGFISISTYNFLPNLTHGI
jgi:hypothetical protein